MMVVRSDSSSTPAEDPGIVISVPDGSSNYLPGARLFAVMASPPKAVTDTRWRQAEAVLSRWFLAEHHKLHPEWADTPQTVLPAHLMVPWQTVERVEPDLRERLHYRMGAAQAVRPFIGEAIKLIRGSTRSKRDKLTIDAAILRTLEEEDNRKEWLRQLEIIEKNRFPSGIDNFDNRVLRRSLPVLHLAIAVADVIDISQQLLRQATPAIQERMPFDIGGPQVGLIEFLNSARLARHAILRAQQYERILAFMRVLRPAPERVVRLRMR